MAGKTDITVRDGRLITTEAASWKDTPYKLNGSLAKKGVGGDCSGTTYQIYSAASCPYAYKMAGEFSDYAVRSGLFRELRADEEKQDGDILSWNSHMAIYASFALDVDNAITPRTNAKGYKFTQVNDMWTASKPSGPPYSPGKMGWFRSDSPRVFRYLK